MRETCAGCGARLDPTDDRCTLCGLQRNASLDPTPPAEEPPEGTTGASVAFQDELFCTECGSASPIHAVYCWKCGAALSKHPSTRSALPPEGAVSAASPRAETRSAARHALWLTAGAIATVIVLFAITQFSGRTDPLRPPPEPAAVELQAPDLPPDVASRISGLEQGIEATDDPSERVILRQELVSALVDFAAFARAGAVQEAVARELETVEAWAEAGSFYLAHVLRTESPDQAVFAERSARAFERALELRPDDLDIKTDLATAYRYHPSDPMRAVNLIQEVLAKDADHARARFNYGVMLAEIGRNEQARAQFEHVINTPGVDEFVRERARELLEMTPG